MTQFVQLAQTALYLCENVTPSDARVGYLLPQGISAPGQFSLSDALTTYPGYFIFFKSLPAGDKLATFISAAQRYLSVSGRAGTRFAFFSSVDPVSPQATIIRAKVSGTQLITTDRADVIFANVTVRLLMGNTVSVNGAGDALTFTPPPPQPNVLLASPLGTGPQASFPLQAPLTLAILTSNVPGCMQFEVIADHTGLTNLDAGLRYFVPSYESPGYVDTMRYPVFDLRALANASDPTQMRFSVILDPVDQLNRARTQFRIDPMANPNPLRSYLRNPLGSVMRLAASGGCALVFAPVVSAPPGAVPPSQPYYLTPMGDFTLALDPAAPSGTYSGNVMCGLSSVEYVTLAASGSTTLSFFPGKPAYAPATYEFDKKGKLSRVNFASLTDHASTSWATLRGQTDLEYFAQPQSAVMHAVPNSFAALGDGPNFLPYLPMQAGAIGTLQGSATEDQSFPLAVYAGVDPKASGDVMTALEYQLLSPTRRRLIPSVSKSARSAAAGANNQGTTPQGLLLQLADGDWKELTLAHSLQGDPTQTVDNYLQIYNARGALRDALQSNQLFLVITDVNAFLRDCDIRYTVTQLVLDGLRIAANIPADVVAKLQPLIGNTYIGKAYLTSVLSCLAPYVLTAGTLDRLASAGIPQTVIAELKPLTDKSYPDIGAFETALKSVLSAQEFDLYASLIEQYAAFGFYTYNGQAVSYGDAIIRGAADFSLWSNGFQFDLSPYQWSSYGTVLIFKFMDKPLRDLAADVQAWSHAADFNQTPSAVAQQLTRIFNSANPNDPDLQYFLNTVASDAAWNGIIAFNARVPLSGLPQQLEGLAAGIDPAAFKAHHAGIDITPVKIDGTGLSIAPSSLFGLIDYEDPDHISDTVSSYQYKVLSLKVLILRSEIEDFSSRVELLANRFFGDLATLQGSSIGNLIDFNGVYQRHGTEGSYLFTSSALDTFAMSSRILDEVIISRAQFVTLSKAQGSTDENIKTKFLFTGTLRFKQFDLFDVFSFGSDQNPMGGLSFSNLAVDMNFNVLNPSYKTFVFDTSATALDASTSTARSASLYNHFPIKLVSLGQGGADNRPDKSNYMPVGSPLSSAGLSDEWYALNFSLNLGTPGALAAAVGFNAGFIAAWSPGGTNSPNMFVGLSLPGVKGGERAISIEGVIKLTFGDIQFIVSASTYILELRNIALSVLSLSFPPNGQTSILLFGDPAGNDRDTLAWYAAYVKNDNSQKKQSLPGLDAGVATWAEHARRHVVPLEEHVRTFVS